MIYIILYFYINYYPPCFLREHMSRDKRQTGARQQLAATLEDLNEKHWKAKRKRTLIALLLGMLVKG